MTDEARPVWTTERAMARLRESCNLPRENRIEARLEWLRRHVWKDWRDDR